MCIFKHTRLKVLTAVNMSILVFWVVTTCGLISKHQRVGETYCTYEFITATHKYKNVCLYVYICRHMLPVFFHHNVSTIFSPLTLLRTP